MKLKKINLINKSYSQENSTLQEIAKVMNLSKERIRQIEAKGLMQMRKKFNSLGIKKDDVLIA